MLFLLTGCPAVGPLIFIEENSMYNHLINRCIYSEFSAKKMVHFDG